MRFLFFLVLWGAVVVCSEGRCGGKVLTTGVVRHACRHRVTARGVVFLGGALLRFILRVVAGAGTGRGASTHCVSPVDRQDEEFNLERQPKGFRFLRRREGMFGVILSHVLEWQHEGIFLFVKMEQSRREEIDQGQREGPAILACSAEFPRGCGR